MERAGQYDRQRVRVSSEHDQEGNNLKVFESFRLRNSASQGQKLALTVFYVPNSLDSGLKLEGSPEEDAGVLGRGQGSTTDSECASAASTKQTPHSS